LVHLLLRFLGLAPNEGLWCIPALGVSAIWVARVATLGSSHSGVGVHLVGRRKGLVGPLLEPQEGKVGESRPGEYAEEAERDGCLHVAHANVARWRKGLVPLVGQVTEAHKVQESPSRRKPKVCDDEAFASLDIGHALKEELSNDEADGRQEGNDGNPDSIVARISIVVIKASLFLGHWVIMPSL